MIVGMLERAYSPFAAVGGFEHLGFPLKMAFGAEGCPAPFGLEKLVQPGGQPVCLHRGFIMTETEELFALRADGGLPFSM